MFNISIEVLDILDEKEFWDEVHEEYGFNLRKDLKSCELNRKDYNCLFKDIMEDTKYLPSTCRGTPMTRCNNSVAYKIRYKDEKRKIGASGGYRLIFILVHNQKVLPLHLYHKKDKKDLTEQEKKNLAKFLKDIDEEFEV